jgi:transposase-like protein
VLLVVAVRRPWLCLCAVCGAGPGSPSKAPQLAAWAEAKLPEGFTVFNFPEAARKRLRTSNMCETLNSQIKRRTRVVGLFPGESSLLRLVTAVLIEISEEWETGKAYLQITETKPTR